LKKLIILLALAFVFTTTSGCGILERIGAKVTGYTEQCVGNVLYYQFTSGSSVAYNTDGTIKTCK
jgi:hypothetical protein